MSNNPLKTDEQQRLQNHVDGIAKDINDGIEITANGDCSHMIEDGEYDEGDYMSAYDYLNDVLDINYITNADKTYKSAKLLVAFGGPNIWIDLHDGLVKGYWWGDYAEAPISGDFMNELDDYLEELFNC